VTASKKTTEKTFFPPDNTNCLEGIFFYPSVISLLISFSSSSSSFYNTFILAIFENNRAKSV